MKTFHYMVYFQYAKYLKCQESNNMAHNLIGMELEARAGKLMRSFVCTYTSTYLYVVLKQTSCWQTFLTDNFTRNLLLSLFIR